MGSAGLSVKNMVTDLLPCPPCIIFAVCSLTFKINRDFEIVSLFGLNVRSRKVLEKVEKDGKLFGA